MPETPPPRPANPRPTVAVIGGGISGLAAAFELTGRAEPDPGAPHVVVFEAGPGLGGKLRADQLVGTEVDTGPDSFLGTRPEALDLCRQVGLGPALVPVAASGATVWGRGRPRHLPRATVSGVPTRLWPLVRSGLLGPSAAMRVGLDLVFPRPPARGPIGDRAFGPLIAHKLGHGVVDALVDPLMGGIHAGGVADMSTAAVNPLLLAVAQERGSFMRSLRQAAARQSTEAVEHSDEGENEEAQDTSSVFWSLTGGVASLGSAVSDVLRTRGVELRTECAVDALATNPRHRSPWVIETRGGPVVVDGVVVALPAGPAATLLGPHDSDAATLLGGIDYASVAVVTLWYPPGALTEDLEGTGMLVPRSTTVPGSPADGPLLVTAVSYLENKWPHLRRDGGVLLRASVGRLGDERFTTMDDEELVARVGGELSVLIGTEGPPSESMVTRWPASFPQYRVHHLLRVAGIESAVKRLPALAVAGAAYRGVGIPACITSGRQAAHEVRDALAGAVGVGPMQ